MEDDKELQWKAASEIFASERHFNQMQNHCRTLASTWLLAAFAGIGFLYKEKPFADAALAAALISLAAAGGVFLLWILDVKIWHRLLLANTIAGHRIESQNAWMPRVRKNISQSQGWFPVRVHLSLFYGLGIAALVAIGASFLCRTNSLRLPDGAPIALLGVGVGIVGAMVTTAYFSHRRDAAVIKKIWDEAPTYSCPGKAVPPPKSPGAALSSA